LCGVDPLFLEKKFIFLCCSGQGIFLDYADEEAQTEDGDDVNMQDPTPELDDEVVQSQLELKGKVDHYGAPCKRSLFPILFYALAYFPMRWL
jgi:hypothetical protein